MPDVKRQLDTYSRGRLFEELLAYVPFLYYRLKSMAQAVHGDGEFSGARRSVLRSLDAQPATVPMLAAERPVARQVMQRLVNELLEEGLVELAQNPMHQRSMLVRLSAQGRNKLREMKALEQEAASGLLSGLSEGELSVALSVIRTLTERMANKDLITARPAAKPRKKRPGR